jgi:ribose transport system permease protein
MLAACQVLTMLTGGIDLSAGIVATCAAFVGAR